MANQTTVPGPGQTLQPLFAQALDQVDDAVIIIDGAQCILYMNAKAAVQYGRPAAEALGKPLGYLHSYRWTSAADEEAAYRALAHAGRWRGQNIHVLADGRQLMVDSTVTVLKDQEGGQIGLMAVIRDVTAQKEAEATLREVQEWQQLALEGGRLGSWVIDLETEATQWDARCRQIFGVSQDEPASSEKGLAIIHPDDRSLALAAFSAATSNASDGIYEVEKRVVWPDGSLHWVATRGRVFYQDMDGVRKPKRLAGVVIDISERKEQEVQLWQANRRARLAEAAAHGFIYEWDPITGQALRSPALSDVLGYQPQEVASDAATWRSLIHPDDYEYVNNRGRAEMAANGSYSLEYRLRHRNGHYVHVWDQAIAESQAGDQPQRIVGITTDISERKQMEQALHETQERFRLALEKAPLSFAHIDRDLRYTWVYNPHPDFDAVSIVGKRDDELSANDATADYMRAKQQVLDRGSGLRAEFTFPLSDGQRVYDITIEPLHDASGAVVGLTTAALDISERRAVEEQVQRSEERLRRTMQTAQVGMAFARADGEVLECNDALLKMLGWSRDDYAAHGLSWQRASRIEDQPLVDQLLQRLHGSSLLSPVEHTFLRQDGSPVATMVSAALLAGGQPGADAPDQSEHVAFIVDLSELKRAQAALQELNNTLERRVAERTAELERSNRDLDRFAYVASHDLKSPLRAIDNLSLWIEEDAAAVLPPTAQVHLAKLRSRVKRLEMLLDDLLLYSRAGRRRHTPENVDTYALVQNVADLLTPPPGFQVQIDRMLPSIRSERPPLEIVLRNLIENAIKHHHQPGAGVIQVTGRRRGELVEFCVADNGPGIAPQFHERIFEVFQTLRPRDEVEGSGMGLAIVKKTVESAGGAIWVQSAAGEGTAFFFTWPAG